MSINHCGGIWEYYAFSWTAYGSPHRVDEILRLILHKSPGFLTVGITGQHQALDESRIHPLDIIMFALGWSWNSGIAPISWLKIFKTKGWLQFQNHKKNLRPTKKKSNCIRVLAKWKWHCRFHSITIFIWLRLMPLLSIVLGMIHHWIPYT